MRASRPQGRREPEVDVMVQESVAQKKCFVISPIGQKGSSERAAADQVLKHLIRKSLASGFDISRADENSNPGAISPTMIASILEADLVIADLSGFNPNVFYELAIAHGYKKPTIHLQKSGETAPFDVKDMRIVRYDMSDLDELEEDQKLLREYANFAMKNSGKMETPLTSAQSFMVLEESTDPVAESNVRVMQAIKELSRDVKAALSARRVRPELSQELSRELATTSALRSIVERVVEGARAKRNDFDSVISQATAVGFDTWVQDLYMKAFPGDNELDINSVLLHPDMVEDGSDDDYEPDEDEVRGR